MTNQKETWYLQGFDDGEAHGVKRVITTLEKEVAQRKATGIPHRDLVRFIGEFKEMIGLDGTKEKEV